MFIDGSCLVLSVKVDPCRLFPAAVKGRELHICFLLVEGDEEIIHRILLLLAGKVRFRGGEELIHMAFLCCFRFHLY